MFFPQVSPTVAACLKAAIRLQQRRAWELYRLWRRQTSKWWWGVPSFCVAGWCFHPQSRIGTVGESSQPAIYSYLVNYWLTLVSENTLKHICDGPRWSYDMFSDGLTLETTSEQQLAVLTVLDLLGNMFDVSRLRWGSKCRRFIWKVRQTLKEQSSKKNMLHIRNHSKWTNLCIEM